MTGKDKSLELRKHILLSVRLANFIEFEKAINQYKSEENCLYELYCTQSGDTVAHLAVRSGCLKILKYLWENFKGPFVFTRADIHGKTPLHVAAQEGSLECIKYLLLSCKVPVDPFKKGDWTPLMLACARGHLSIVQELINTGANLHLRNKDGWTAFHIASRTGCIDILKCLHNRDQSLCYTKSENRRTPLHTAALHGHLDVAEFLIDTGKLQADEQDACGNSPLMDAARSKNVQVLHLLIVKSMDSGKASDLLGRNVLHIAAECGSNSCIKYIIQNRITDLNCRSLNGGQTALHYAAKEGHVETVKLLLHSGIDNQIKDSKERTAMDIANLKKHYSCMEEMKHYDQFY